MPGRTLTERAFLPNATRDHAAVKRRLWEWLRRGDNGGMNGLLCRGALVVLTMLTAAACGPGESVLRRGNVSEPDTLDPHRYTLAAETEIMRDMFAGLTTVDAAGDIIPGSAESWTASEDGRVWTFRLRENLRWSDGAPLTAADFVAGLRRAVDPATHALFANLAYKMKNARAINEGDLAPRALGAYAPDDRTVVIELERPSPIILLLAALPLYAPLPRHVFEEHGEAWSRPGNMVSNGPYVLSGWVPQDHVRLVRNPFFYDAGNVTIETVDYLPTEDDGAALKRFRAGELDLNLRFPPNSAEWIEANLPGEAFTHPALTVNYLVFNLTNPKFADVRVRRALSLAIDRETITAAVLRGGEVPAFGVVPTSIKGYVPAGAAAPDGRDMAARREAARTLLAEAGYGPDNPLRLTLHIRVGELNRRVAIAVQDMWAQAGAAAEIIPEEVKVHYNRLRGQEFEAADAGWNSPADPEYFLYLLRRESVEANYGRYDRPEFDSLVYDTEAEMDLARRYARFAEAEALAMADAPLVPLFFTVNRSLVGKHVGGFVPNALDYHPTRFLKIVR